MYMYVPTVVDKWQSRPWGWGGGDKILNILNKRDDFSGALCTFVCTLYIYRQQIIGYLGVYAGKWTLGAKFVSNFRHNSCTAKTFAHFFVKFSPSVFFSLKGFLKKKQLSFSVLEKS